MSDDRIRIQNFIRGLAVAAKFPRVVYETTGEARLLDGDAQALTPQTCLCNETASEFGKDSQFGRGEAMARSRWGFDLWLTFAQEVSLEDFEASLCNPVPRQAANKTRGQRGFAVRLQKTYIDHPVTQNAPNGTSARLVFEVEISRN